MDKYFFGWTNIKKILREWWRTLSNEKSFLSSKRLTTFVANNSVVILTWFFVIYTTLTCKLDPMGFTIVIAPLTVMGGYNIAMGYKDKKPGDVDQGNPPSAQTV